MKVPVLYKISTVVDSTSLNDAAQVPVLYKISTVVDFNCTTVHPFCSRSLQNFYCCR